MIINGQRKTVIRVGSRGSKLALIQAESVIRALIEHNPRIKTELVPIKTAGDVDRESALDKADKVGFFTKQIESELLDGRIDIAVHSAKDLPSESVDGLIIGAVPVRRPAEDVWISGDDAKIGEMISGNTVGTGSPRRRAMLMNIRPDLEVSHIRGNVETRLKKLNDGHYDAIILARAGLFRLGLEKSITEILPIDDFLPAPGQGALAVQVRSDDTDVIELVKIIDDSISHRCLDIERLFMHKLGVGCSAAVGGFTFCENGQFHLKTAVLDMDGASRITASYSISADRPDESLVGEVMNRLISEGAADLIALSDERKE
jgi:hydroxymethylbilane synthase